VREVVSGSCPVSFSFLLILCESVTKGLVFDGIELHVGFSGRKIVKTNYNFQVKRCNLALIMVTFQHMIEKLMFCPVIDITRIDLVFYPQEQLKLYCLIQHGDCVPLFVHRS
jgi:hypothetical protein